jgi:uncharacterized protein YbaP (TraB family)
MGLLGLPAAARAQPALWRADSATAHVYLFGTMHILPKKADWLSPKIAAAFALSGTLWEEADVGISNPQLAAHIMTQAMAPDFDLWSALPAPYATKFRGQLHSCGLDPLMAAHVKPWMASMMVTICQMMGTHGGNLGPAADNPEAVLLSRARADGKSLQYFETAEQQIGYMSGAPQSAQLAQLRQAIDEAQTGQDEFGKLETAWVSGDVAKIAASVAASRKEDEAFYQTIFVQRNARFAARIADMLRGRGTIFVAIGAGHLAGDDSVIRLLDARGVTVTRQ